MREIHMSPADLMSARNGTATVVRVADWDSGIEVALDVEDGEMRALHAGIARVVLSPADFELIAQAKGRGHEVTADDGAAYGVSVWA
ncbi:hypothetical protein ACIA5D_36640 [Actinoplanes sp. NPDC051513]|uniref:hypothetical protein n=1 Tax=Actinoplanes sp. NPDC051513 TaxID=3363908 RepID=UPI0037B0A355